MLVAQMRGLACRTACLPIRTWLSWRPAVEASFELRRHPEATHHSCLAAYTQLCGRAITTHHRHTLVDLSIGRPGPAGATQARVERRLTAPNLHALAPLFWGRKPLWPLRTRHGQPPQRLNRNRPVMADDTSVGSGPNTRVF